MSRRATVVAWVLLMSFLTGCTEPAVDTGAVTTDKSPNAPSDESSSDRGKSRRREPQRSDARRPAKAGSGQVGSGSTEDGEETTREGGHGRGDPFAAASSVVEDPVGDMAGDPAPAYAEVVGASITGRGDTVEVVVSMGAPLPDRVGERDNLLAGVGIEYGGRMGGIAVSVQGTHDGWLPSIHRDGGQRELDRGFEIEGNRFVWTVPWDDLGGARRFRWGASVRWFQFESGDLSQATQAQDSAPGAGPATYPGS